MPRRASVFLLVFLGAGLLLRCGGSTADPAGPGNPTPTPAAGGGADVVIRITGINGGMSFAPAAATVKVGQTVAWQNTDSTTHRVILTGVFDTRFVEPGQTSTGTRMTTPDTYSYICTIHPSMNGTVIVTP